MPLKGTIALVKESYAFYQLHAKLLIGIALVPAIVDIGLSLLQSSGTAAATGSLTGSPMAAVVSILSFVVSMLATIALIVVINDPQKEYTIQRAFTTAKSHFFQYLVVALFCGITVALGFVFFIIPGVILAVWFSFANFIVLLEGKKGSEALKASKEYVRGLWFAVFARIIALVLVAFGILFTFAVVVGEGIFSDAIITFVSTLLTPFALTYMYFLYRDVRANKHVNVVT